MSRACPAPAAPHGAEVRPLPRVALIGCGAKKLSHAAPARDLYTGSLFRAALTYAEATADAVFIVSAFHGLLPLDQVIEPYDRTIAQLGGVRERDVWGERVVDDLCRRFGDAPLDVELLVGEAYARHLRGPLILRTSEAYTGRRWPRRPTEPLLGLQVGERLQWLKRALMVAILDEGLVAELLSRVKPERLAEIQAYASREAARVEDRARRLHGSDPVLLDQLDDYTAAYLFVLGLLLLRAHELRKQSAATRAQAAAEDKPSPSRLPKAARHAKGRSNRPPGPWSPPVPRVAKEPKHGAPAPAAPRRPLPTPEEILSHRPLQPPKRRSAGGAP